MVNSLTYDNLRNLYFDDGTFEVLLLLKQNKKHFLVKRFMKLNPSSLV